MAEIAALEELSKLAITNGTPEQASTTSKNLEENSNRSYSKGEERHNHATLALHEACESGNMTEVQTILAEGRAVLNALIAGHRAFRTAMHKASAHGHTDVVKLLLKSGANPDKTSSVQRTALHEVCTGGHVETLSQLVLYTKDLDKTDNHGQTAAHIAAYHGETGCLKVLIENGCDVNYQDRHMCTPAHLAVKKNYPETLQCLLGAGNIDPHKADKQGRNPIHYAAIYGSIGCLNVFKKCKVDVMVTDKNGATSAHHAAAGGHLECLKFLIKVGITLDRRDKSGKTIVHYAAQKGSTGCLHWLLEQGANASLTDVTGHTPAHCAASGHMSCMNCLITHGTDITIINQYGDTPDMLSRKYGHTLAFQKAVNSEIKCQFCVKQKAQQEYDLKHQPSEVEKSIKQEEKVIFKSPIKTRPNTKAHHRRHSRQTSIKPTNSKRDLSSQYYGDHIFTFSGK